MLPDMTFKVIRQLLFVIILIMGMAVTGARPASAEGDCGDPTNSLNGPLTCSTYCTVSRDGNTTYGSFGNRIMRYRGGSSCQCSISFIAIYNGITLKDTVSLDASDCRDQGGSWDGLYISGYRTDSSSDSPVPWGIEIDARRATFENECVFTLENGLTDRHRIRGLTIIVAPNRTNKVFCNAAGTNLYTARSVRCASGQAKDCEFRDVTITPRAGCPVMSDDDDGDCIVDTADNCPVNANTDQVDADQDGDGDVCDLLPLDRDNDTVQDSEDYCPTIPAIPGFESDHQCQPTTREQCFNWNGNEFCTPMPAGCAVAVSSDGDAFPDQCDPDDDNDGICDEPRNASFGEGATCVMATGGLTDNCPLIANADQSDDDDDGTGDLCDACPNDPLNDWDGDGVCGDVDNCPFVRNSGQDTGACDTSLCAGVALDDGNACTVDFCTATTGVVSHSAVNVDDQNVCTIDTCNPATGFVSHVGINQDDGDPCTADFCNPVAGVGHTLLPDGDGDRICNDQDTCPLDRFNDIDRDDVCGNTDNCPFDPNGNQADADGDGVGDACEVQTDNDDDGDNFPDVIDRCRGEVGTVNGCPDTDGDGIANRDDLCPGTPRLTLVQTNGCPPIGAEADGDGDGIADRVDLCPGRRSTQIDMDDDESGDECDDDRDGDGLDNDGDNCPNQPNPGQADRDRDDIGDVCEGSAFTTDSDGDTILDILDCAPLDRLKFTLPACYGDADGDGSSDIQELERGSDPAKADTDDDGVLDVVDCDPVDETIGQTGTCNGEIRINVDPDGDGIGLGDNCPFVSNADQRDSDEDEIGDQCDPTPSLSSVEDLDGDGSIDDTDNCPLVPNAGQSDTDNDGVGDRCQGDRDGDTIGDAADNCPSHSNTDQADVDGDGKGNVCDEDFTPAVSAAPSQGGGGCSLIPGR